MLYSSEVDFLNTLDELTKIATKTKLNVDYVPGLVTVVHGSDLKKAGITNLTAQNAFDIILGMESVVSSIRGIGSWYGAKGNKIKWMINDKPVETELKQTDDWGSGPVLFPISVDYIDRIEVIRGSASAIYGDSAMFGVINIVTKKDVTGGNITFEQLGNGHYLKQVGAFMNAKGDDYSFDLSVLKLDSDGYNLHVGGDGHFYGDFDASRQWFGYGPGKLPLYMQSYSIMADLNYKNYKFWAYKFNTDLGQGYDWIPTDMLPPFDNDTYGKTSDITMVGAEKRYEFRDSFYITPKISYTLYSNPAYFYKFSKEWFEKYWTDNEVEPTDGYLYRKYREEKINFSTDFEYELKGHALLAGFFIQNTKQLRDVQFRNFIVGKGLTKDFFQHSRGLTKHPNDRVQKAIFVQDSVDITNWLTMTVGARYDNFSDVGDEFSPRFALVSRLDDVNILKMQISRAFRPPTFFENYGYMVVEHMKPETIDTIEASYIYNDREKRFTVTIFDSTIKHMITKHFQSYYFMNLEKDAKLKGGEFEFKIVRDSFEVGINHAIYKSKNKEYGEEFALSANYMGNIFLTINQDSDYSTSFWYRYISKKPRLEDSSNGYIPAQDYLNITQAFENIIKNGDLHVGVRNIFDEVQTTLYSPLNPPNYDDIPYLRRSFWVNFSYRF